MQDNPIALYQAVLSNLDDYFARSLPITIYTPNLSIQGIKLIKEALNNPNIKVYGGTAKRKTEKMKWLQHNSFGRSCPSTFCIKLSNGVRIYDYSKFDPCENPNPEEAQALCNILVKDYDAPFTPSTIIKNNLECVNKLQFKNKYGIVIGRLDETVQQFTYPSFFGGAVYILKKNGGYKKIPFETHIDYHQMYATIMKNRSFPNFNDNYTVEDGFVDHPLAIYHIGDGRIRLKKDGFPLLAIEKKGVLAEDYFSTFVDIPWKYLTKPDWDILVDNFEMDPLHPIEIIETFYYNSSISGAAIFGGFIDYNYQQRQKSSGAIKRFYKMVNEYLPGTFERKYEISYIWKDLETPEQGKTHAFNNIIGTFITAYGRECLNRLLKFFPYNKVIGYDTDCVFFAGKPEEVPSQILQFMGSGMGQLHFDGVMKDACHLAPKQYFGFDLVSGELIAKMAGVKSAKEVAENIIAHNYNIAMAPTAEEVLIWNPEVQDYVCEIIPAKVSLENFKDYERPLGGPLWQEKIKEMSIRQSQNQQDQASEMKK